MDTTILVLSNHLMLYLYSLELADVISGVRFKHMTHGVTKLTEPMQNWFGEP